mmetsp:Transcript_29487/g.33781  ORF Transcript_29487/g.33781 Transcript_29487/m.33781 type:complete len:212 (-) Transcript_29487:860-1495(-)
MSSPSCLSISATWRMYFMCLLISSSFFSSSMSAFSWRSSASRFSPPHLKVCLSSFQSSISPFLVLMRFSWSSSLSSSVPFSKDEPSLPFLLDSSALDFTGFPQAARFACLAAEPVGGFSIFFTGGFFGFAEDFGFEILLGSTSPASLTSLAYCDSLGNSFSLSAYLIVLREWSAWEYPGETQAIIPMQMFFFVPMNESLNTIVSFDALKGR